MLISERVTILLTVLCALGFLARTRRKAGLATAAAEVPTDCDGTRADGVAPAPLAGNMCCNNHPQSCLLYLRFQACQWRSGRITLNAKNGREQVQRTYTAASQPIRGSLQPGAHHRVVAQALNRPVHRLGRVAA
jgi:hypothetical protein